MKRRAARDGFTMLFAVLTISLLMTAGLAIFDFSYKETLLARIARDSQQAFFAADTGAECALYLDFKQNDGALDIFAFGVGPISGSSNISCYGQELTIADGTNPERAFELELGDQGCAEVTVERNAGTTTIKSRGRNLSCADTSGKTQVERAIRVDY